MPDNNSPQTLRLNKAIASSGLCSRRKADELISQGRVSVNGHMIQDMGQKIDPGTDQVRVDGHRLALQTPTRPVHIYILLHKPVRVVSTASDPQSRTTVLDLLPGSWRQRRPVPVGRLDYFSQGLLLLTTDGELVYRLTHPKWHISKVYHVLVRGQATQAKLQRMQQGMQLAEGESLAPVQVTAVRAGKETSWLTMRLIQGVNRQIRRMCRDLDLTILRLIRVQEGPVVLGDLPSGKARELSSTEIKALKAEVELETKTESRKHGLSCP
ncbi:MAG: pseudouridine synthase [Desulfovermiculus sp.]